MSIDERRCGALSKAFFITGTDTDVGKTTAAVAILLAARRLGSTAAIKPVAAGCEATSLGLRNDDALQLQRAATLKLSYQQVNPIALKLPIAPHLAAAQEGRSLTVAELVAHCRSIMKLHADLTLIEGAGGWRVPLNDTETFADLVKALAVPVVLVVDIKLGCLNHALLTAEAINRDGLRLAGWIANSTGGPDKNHDLLVETLRLRLDCALLAVLPYVHHGVEQDLAACVAIEALC